MWSAVQCHHASSLFAYMYPCVYLLLLLTFTGYGRGRGRCGEQQLPICLFLAFAYIHSVREGTRKMWRASLTHIFVSCLHSQGTGEDEEDVESSSATLVQTEEGFQPVFFDPRPLKNLLLVDELPSLMPLLDIKVGVCACVWAHVELARAIYIRCIHGMFGR